MNIILKYFSGTGNSYKILATCKSYFNQNGCNAKLSSIIDEPNINEIVSLIGFCFPVYAFGIPRICRKYLLNLPKVSSPRNAFVLITAGEVGESGFAIKETVKILKAKGFKVTYSAVIQMPSNWTVSLNPPAKDEAQSIIEKGIDSARKISKHILSGKSFYHIFNYPPNYTKVNFYKNYYLFKWLGVSNLWRNFRTDETCNSCKLCLNICPTNSIKFVENKPKWLKTCEQCMRCVNYCPTQAIFQKGQGSIKGKNIYYEPTFKPLKDKKHNKSLNAV